jgi:hypothetical protein
LPGAQCQPAIVHWNQHTVLLREHCADAGGHIVIAFGIVLIRRIAGYVRIAFRTK